MTFGNSEQIEVLKLPATHRRNLILVRAGSKPRPWLFDRELPGERGYDVGLNYYAPPHPDDRFASAADLVCSGGLSKMHAAKRLFEATDVHQRYDGVWFLDDDIEVLFDPDPFFEFCRANALDIAQPALTPDCTTAIGLTRQHPGLKFRTTNWVEVMAPYFRRDFLVEMLHSFDMSISGWGLDLYWGHHLGERWRAGIVDEFLMRHTNPSDHDAGAFYQYLRSMGVDPRQEMASMLGRVGLTAYEAKPTGFTFHSYRFGT